MALLAVSVALIYSILKKVIVSAQASQKKGNVSVVSAPDIMIITACVATVLVQGTTYVPAASK
jgi:Flp pilus assembly secretin CpaC